MYKWPLLKLVLPCTLPAGNAGEILLAGGGENDLPEGNLFGAGETATRPFPKDGAEGLTGLPIYMLRLLLRIAEAPLLAEGLVHARPLPAAKPVRPARNPPVGFMINNLPVSGSRKWLVTNS